MDAKEDEKKAGNCGMEYKSVSSDKRNYEDTEAETDSSNGKQSTTGNSIKASDFKRKLTQ
jgi:hypothetical protein